MDDHVVRKIENTFKNIETKLDDFLLSENPLILMSQRKSIMLDFELYIECLIDLMGGWEHYLQYNVSELQELGYDPSNDFYEIIEDTKASVSYLESLFTDFREVLDDE